ncbi:MAG: hypothetical protein ACYTGH_20575 [Planctomycetota bacterium]|jgi:hypothetical protein
MTTTQEWLGLDQFPILGWSSVPVALSRPEVFATIADCGINLFMTTGMDGGPSDLEEAKAAVRKQLDLAAEHGLKAIVCDRRFIPQVRPGDEGWKREADAGLADYVDHPAVAGFHVLDEPIVNGKGDRPDVEDVGRMVRYLTAQSPGTLAYANGLGLGSRGMNSFEEYLDAFVGTIDPQIISTDCYPLTTVPDESLFPGYVEDDCGLMIPELGSYYREAYWEGWETQRRIADRYSKPIWGFVLSVPHTHSHWFYGPVTEGTIRLEAFTALAYGAQGIQYFSMRTNTRNNNYEDSIIAPDGRPSLRYEYFRRVNRDLAVLGPILSRLRPAGVYYRGYIPSGGKRFRFGRHPGDQSHRPLAHIDGSDNLLLSFFDGDKGKRYLLVINNHPAKRTRFRLTLEAGWHFQEIIKHTGVPRNLGQHQLANFEPGDARLYRMIHNHEDRPLEAKHEVN